MSRSADQSVVPHLKEWGLEPQMDFQPFGDYGIQVVHFETSGFERRAFRGLPFNRVCVRMTPFDHHAIWDGGRCISSGRSPVGSVELLGSGEDYEHEVRPSSHRQGVFGLYIAPHSIATLGVGTSRLRRRTPARVDPWLVTIARRILALRGGQGNLGDLEAAHLVLSTAAYVARAYGDVPDTASAGSTGGLAPWQLRRVLEVMAGGIASAIRIEHLAREVSLSPYHFVRAFKRSVGTSPHRYLTMLRVQRAQELLGASHQSIQDIAESCGFAEAGSLIRVFRRHTGMTPNEHRRAMPRARPGRLASLVSRDHAQDTTRPG